ncbi:hypothetical protein HRbin23_01615 [bacterium HR23]|nr:hypothetical protein HRbin23_01615 [bacterium HR23]
MPPLARWFVRSSLVYLGVSLGLWAVQGAAAVWALPAGMVALAPAALHLFFVGWATQMIMGVAFWMFPRERQRPFGSLPLAWATFGLLNLGLLMRLVGEPLHTLYPQGGWGWMLGASGVLQWLAGVGFVVNTWGRIRGR